MPGWTLGIHCRANDRSVVTCIPAPGDNGRGKTVIHVHPGHGSAGEMTNDKFPNDELRASSRWPIQFVIRHSPHELLEHRAELGHSLAHLLIPFLRVPDLDTNSGADDRDRTAGFDT